MADSLELPAAPPPLHHPASLVHPLTRSKRSFRDSTGSIPSDEQEGVDEDDPEVEATTPGQSRRSAKRVRSNEATSRERDGLRTRNHEGAGTPDTIRSEGSGGSVAIETRGDSDGSAEPPSSHVLGQSTGNITGQVAAALESPTPALEFLNGPMTAPVAVPNSGGPDTIPTRWVLRVPLTRTKPC